MRFASKLDNGPLMLAHEVQRAEAYARVHITAKLSHPACVRKVAVKNDSLARGMKCEKDA